LLGATGKAKEVNVGIVDILTAALVQKYFGEQMDKHDLAEPIKKFESFKRTFITDNRDIDSCKERLERKPDFYKDNYERYLTSGFRARFERPETSHQAKKHLSIK